MGKELSIELSYPCDVLLFLSFELLGIILCIATELKHDASILTYVEAATL